MLRQVLRMLSRVLGVDGDALEVVHHVLGRTEFAQECRLELHDPPPPPPPPPPPGLSEDSERCLSRIVLPAFCVHARSRISTPAPRSSGTAPTTMSPPVVLYVPVLTSVSACMSNTLSAPDPWGFRKGSRWMCTQEWARGMSGENG